MSIESAAKDLATELVRHEQVEIICHHDADGIAAGAIMSIALYRARIPFRLRTVSRLQAETLPSGRETLLCDLGSGIADLPEETMVIDHHLPVFSGPNHVNPRLSGIDGDTSLSGAGAAYLVANAIGDNRDLAGLVLTGIIGDGQQLIGKNHEIFLEGIGNGIITAKRGIRLPGRDLTEQLVFATSPYLPGITGEKEEVASLISRCSGRDEKPAPDLLISSLVIGSAGFCRADALRNLYGDTYQLEREVIEDAATMTMLIDACGKEGQGSIAAALCLRSSREIATGWEVARSHRIRLVGELKRILASPSESGVYEIHDPRLASDIADTITGCMDRNPAPVIVYARDEDGSCHLSVRIPQPLMAETQSGLGTLVQSLAAECGGSGGGHTTRAGAWIAGEHLDRFITGINGAFA